MLQRERESVMPKKLNEKELKRRLVDYILSQFPKCELIGVEVPFVSMKRRVDVLLVTAKKELIAYEIKSDVDSLRRWKDQKNDYKQTFDKLYIVTSERFKDISLKSDFIGRIYINGNIKEKKVAKTVTRLNKKNLACFIWKDKIVKMGYDKKESVEVLRTKLINDSKNIATIRELAINSLLGRYSKRFEMFKKYKEQKTSLADLDYLTKDFNLNL